jgi:hypothetical protein
MIWKIKNEDVRKSALWALISIPISILFLGMLVHGDGILQAPYIPGFIILELFGIEESWIFPAQYPRLFPIDICLYKDQESVERNKRRGTCDKKGIDSWYSRSFIGFWNIWGSLLITSISFFENSYVDSMLRSYPISFVFR